MSGSIVSAGLRTRVRGMAEPVARGFGRLGLTPNHLTFIGFGIACVAAVAAAQQAWLIAGLLVLFGGVFDLFDGALARATNKVSKLGAFYDSVFDRGGEALVYIGIAFGCARAGFVDGQTMALVAMASSSMVSYTRAKGEGLGFPSGGGLASVGLAPREVRIVILAMGLLGTGLAGGIAVGSGAVTFSGGSVYVAAALVLITILATITTIQRILHVRAQAREG